jgi:threonylcarbamoyladenosine tRNA methylthiotransferase MtaB
LISMNVAVTTLGCKVNQCESAGMIEAIMRRGHRIVGFNETADVYIINTCTVTARTDFQSRQLVRRAHRRNPQAAIVVTGCYAQVFPGAAATLPGVALVAGNPEKEEIPSLVGKLARGEQKTLISDVRGTESCTGPYAARFHGHTRSFLKVQDGCDAFCSYCIVPLARGRSRSLPAKEVLDRAALLAGAGHREIVLTGVHLGAYGADLRPKTDLISLIRKIEQSGFVQRLRLSSIEPREVSDEMIDYLRDSKALCGHFHIPLQSGDDNILRLMGRDYDRAFFRDLLKKITSSLPETAVGIDVMTGFPGEDDAAFERTLEFVESLPVAYLHVFPYSERPGTAALKLPGRVSGPVKSSRGEKLRIVGQKKRRAFAERFTGKTLKVLVEDRRDRGTGMLKGFSRNYIPVLVEKGDSSLVNREIDVVVIETADGRVTGRVSGVNQDG